MQFGSWKAETDMVYYSHKRKVLSEKRVPEIRKDKGGTAGRKGH